MVVLFVEESRSTIMSPLHSVQRDGIEMDTAAGHAASIARIEPGPFWCPFGAFGLGPFGHKDPVFNKEVKRDMAAWKGIVGKSYTSDEFDAYCHTLHWSAWRPSFIVLHNTGAPSLAQRPDGLTGKHIQNLEAFYRDTQKWSAGPHLFIDDRQIWVFTPLTVSGVHSPSWNSVSIGIEMLGDYDTEAFDSGRGLAVRKHTVSAIATLSAVLGLDAGTMKIHREDPKTTHACPGKHVRKLEVIQDVQDLIEARHHGAHLTHPDP
ncbi:peptidoglycan recognition family protein [uncultured Thiodictyon sp.]|uniref:peptidoglycan recognition protein family protein n=1 Tax=uncultured Thiodictyon sp. TaxID=1846217 RepID=UPI0025D0A44F|nr:peptidoglycan recognition family protein [uncultured Thiodictyon sp.]